MRWRASRFLHAQILNDDAARADEGKGMSEMVEEQSISLSLFFKLHFRCRSFEFLTVGVHSSTE